MIKIQVHLKAKSHSWKPQQAISPKAQSYHLSSSVIAACLSVATTHSLNTPPTIWWWCVQIV